MAAPTVNAQRNQATQQRQSIPFCRAARRKQIQAITIGPTTISGGGVVALAPIELPAAGFLRDIVMNVSISSTGNAATVALPAIGDAPWSVFSSIQVTNAAGDSIYVPMQGYFYYLVQKYMGMYEPPFNDPRADPGFVALTTGAGATAGSGSFVLRIPFEQDPRDAFCALPNLAANKAYQILINLNPTSVIFQGGTAPNGTVTVTLTLIMNYWSQPNAANGDGYPQQVAPGGAGSVSLFRLQTTAIGGGGNRVTQLFNVGNVIKSAIFVLYDSASPSKRDDVDFPAINYVRLNNDQLLYKPTNPAFWQSEMKMRTGFGAAAGTKDTAGNLDTGVYVVTDFMSQHEKVAVDSPRDQYLVTLDSTLLQHEGAVFGGSANTLYVLTNEIKPASADALYSLNYV